MSLIFNHDSVNSFLVSELDRRKQKNSNYSLRAFARDLKISPSRLSEIIKGTAGLSEAMATEMSTHLKLKPTEKKYWYDLILATASRNKNIKALALKRIRETQKTNRLKEIKEGEFKVISDWHHAAILELTVLKSFKFDAEWIANKLGITSKQVIEAIKRLKKLNLLVEKNGMLTANPEAYQTFSEMPQLAYQNFHKQILTKAVHSIEKHTRADRQSQSMVVAIPKSQLPHFGEKIKLFMQNFWEEMDGMEKDELYALSIQLVPVNKS